MTYEVERIAVSIISSILSIGIRYFIVNNIRISQIKDAIYIIFWFTFSLGISYYLPPFITMLLYYYHIPIADTATLLSVSFFASLILPHLSIFLLYTIKKIKMEIIIYAIINRIFGTNIKIEGLEDDKYK